MLEGRNFVLYTDHKPLTYAFVQRSDKCSPRQLRQLDFISQFTTDIRHVKGVENIPADTLSRTEAITCPMPINYQEMADAQFADSDLQRYLSDTTTSLKLQKYRIPNTTTELYCDTSSGKLRPFVPQALRKQVFDSLHNISHPGCRATAKLVADRFVWPKVKKDCQDWAKCCIPCQRSKIHLHTKAPVNNILVNNKRFSHVHLDLVGPLPISNNSTYCLTIVDRFTRWVEAEPLPNIEAETVAKAFFKIWIARFGAPEIITTDQGRQFESHLFRSLATLLGAKHIHTCAFHPQANGLLENWHRTFKASLKAYLTDRWTEVLPTVLLGLRTIFREDLKCTAADLVYGQTIRLPGEFFTPVSADFNSTEFIKTLKANMDKLRPTATRLQNHGRLFVPSDLSTCSHVFVRHDAVRAPLQPPYDGPFEVISRTEKLFKIRRNGKEIVVSIDRLKPSFTLTEEVHDPASSLLAEPNSPVAPTVTSRPKRTLHRPVCFASTC